MSNETQNNDYWNLTLEGKGYINRFRKVTPDQGDPYYSVTIAAMRGKANNEGHIQKTFIDCNVLGAAKGMVKQLESFFEGENDPKVMVKFMLGDLEQRAFVYKSGDRKGQTGFSLKGRLFDIKWYKVNGDATVFSPAEIERKKIVGSTELSPAAANSTNTDDADSQQAQVDALQAELPKEVQLVKDDPFYEEREQQLIKQGYHYQGGNMWLLVDAA